MHWLLIVGKKSREYRGKEKRKKEEKRWTDRTGGNKWIERRGKIRLMGRHRERKRKKMRISYAKVVAGREILSDKGKNRDQNLPKNNNCMGYVAH